MKKIGFKEVCRSKTGSCLHVSEKYTHIRNFVNGDYFIFHADKVLNCVFQDCESTEPTIIPAEKAQYLDYYELYEK